MDAREEEEEKRRVSFDAPDSNASITCIVIDWLSPGSDLSLHLFPSPFPSLFVLSLFQRGISKVHTFAGIVGMNPTTLVQPVPASTASHLRLVSYELLTKMSQMKKYHLDETR